MRLLLPVALLATFAPAQIQFDVASVKPEAPSRVPPILRPSPGRISGVASTRSLVQFAYKLQEYQLAGPRWIDTDLYRLDARTERSDASLDDMRLMMRELLRDRFKLVFREEQRLFSAYVLVVDKSGDKLKRVADDDNSIGRCNLEMLFCGYGTTERAAIALQILLDQPVFDQTGLEGRFEFPLDFDRYTLFGRTPPEGYDKPSLFAALPAQLGLRLEAKKETIRVFVVTSIQRPTED